MASPLRRYDSMSDSSRWSRTGLVIPVDRAARPVEPVVVRVVPDLSALAAEDPDHHLWKNGRLWWIAFTVHRGHLQERIRHSLGTADRAEARRRRDEVLARAAEDPARVLALRLAPGDRRRSKR